MEENYFTKLLNVDVSGHIEKKNGLSYVSWANCWAEVKTRHPDAVFTIYENSNGWNYFTDGKTCWVKTGVTINGIEHIEYLPVMDFRNKSIPANGVTSVDVNKSIQRSLTKACARHGLGLSVYAGEDIWVNPEKKTDDDSPETKSEPPLSPAAEAERDKEFEEIKSKVVAFYHASFIDNGGRESIDTAIREKNIKYLRNILTYCEGQSKKAS